MSLLSSMLTAAVGPVVNGLADVFGMSGQAHYQRVNQRASAELQHEENKYWAEYNTPANQMARLKAAGLNPNLVYGNGADAQFQGSVSPSGSMPSMRGGYGTDFMTMQNISAQNQKLKAEADLAKSQQAKVDEDRRGVEYDNQRKLLTLPYAAKLEWDKHLMNKSEMEKNQSVTLLNDSQRQLNTLQYNAQSPVLHDIMDNMKKRGDLEVELMDIEKDFKPHLLAAQLNVSNATASHLIAQVAVARSLRKYYDELTDKTQKDAMETVFRTYGHFLQNEAQEISNEVNNSEVKKFMEKYITPILSGIGSVIGSATKAIGAKKMLDSPASPTPIIGFGN